MPKGTREGRGSRHESNDYGGMDKRGSGLGLLLLYDEYFYDHKRFP